MKRTYQIWFPALGLLAALSAPILVKAQTPRYLVTDLGTPGLHGPVSLAFGVNNAGRVGGQAMTKDGNFHAFLSGVGHTLIDLGTLGGPNSGGGGPNLADAVPILSDTKTMDPLGEDFCAFGTHLICLGAIWQEGVLTPLLPVGGNNSDAQAINNAGQVTGWAENGTMDTSCAAWGPQALDYQAVVWGPGPGQVQKLPPLAGDTVSFALGINDLGQVVGSSGTCAATPLAPFAFGPHAVLWQNGVPQDLGSLNPGGSALNVGASINNLGEVVGGSILGGALHTYKWTAATGMQDLGLLDSDLGNLPGAGSAGINNQSQVVGGSCVNDALCNMANPDLMMRAYLWQGGKMMDLNALVVGGPPLHLLIAYGINDSGVITGFGVTDDGETHAFVATPLPGKAAGHEEDARPEARTVVVPEAARKMLRQRMPSWR